MFAADKSDAAAIATTPSPVRMRHLSRPLQSMWRRIRRMLECRRQRRALLELDEHLLADIGVSREQAKREAGKPYWMLTGFGRC
jgi:uncharacterized protein YjiS (DUF1127 family)